MNLDRRRVEQRATTSFSISSFPVRSATCCVPRVDAKSWRTGRESSSAAFR